MGRTRHKKRGDAQDGTAARYSPERLNTFRAHLLSTLLDLSDFERQRAYKNAVPFVHVPRELCEQLWQYSPQHAAHAWYDEVIPAGAPREAILVLWEGLRARFPGRIGPDVPAIFSVTRWREVAQLAARAYDALVTEAMLHPRHWMSDDALY